MNGGEPISSNRCLCFALAACCVLLAACDAGPDLHLLLPSPWPPEVGKSYPELELLGADGEPLKLSSFAGQVILIEPIGMNCPACNAFAGGNRRQTGGFRGLAPQQGLPEIGEILEERAGVRLPDRRLVFLHLLLYDFDMEAPDVEDARLWEEHFDVGRVGGRVVVPAYDLRGPATYDLIPGFQLIDRDFVLRYDATGHHPSHNLWQDLVPALPRLLR